MSRRLVEIGSALVALGVLAIVLFNATLVDRVPPSVLRVSLSAPAPGNDTTGEAQTAIDVQFSEAVRTSTVEPRFHIAPAIAGTFNWETSRTLVFTPSDKLPSSTSYTITIDSGFQDLAGNASSAGVKGWTFTTVGPPTVVETSPGPFAVDVAVDAPIKLTFDRLMDTTSSLAAVQFDQPVRYHAKWSGPVLSLILDGPLSFGATYTLTVGTDARGTDGTHLSEPFVTSFTTVAAGLVALRTVPAPNAAGVSVRTPIAIIYDGPLDPSTIANVLTVTPPVSGDLRAVDLLDDSQPIQTASPVSSAGGTGHVLLFTPSQPLASHTTYTVALRPVVHLLGDPGQVAAGQTWSFTTGQPTQSGQNQIAFLSARAGVRNVWLMNPDGSNPRQITTELVPVTSYDVSPDATTLIYAAGGVVRRMKIDGSDMQLLTRSGFEEYGGLITPDGAAVVVGRRDSGGNDQGYWRVPLPGGSGDERQITPDGAPGLGSVASGGDGLGPGPGSNPWARGGAFSPDGHDVLLVGGDGVVRLVDLTAPAGTQPIRLTLVSEGSAAWDSADSSFYVVGRDGGVGDPAVWRITTTGEVSRTFRAAGGLGVSKDGHFAVLIGSIAGEDAVAYADSPSVPSRMVSDEALADRSPSFAPDGDSIIFSRVPVAQPFRSAGIWVVGVDGSGLRQLSTDGVSARWLP